jgi:hypothetical protein
VSWGLGELSCFCSEFNSGLPRVSKVRREIKTCILVVSLALTPRFLGLINFFVCPLGSIPLYARIRVTNSLCKGLEYWSSSMYVVQMCMLIINFIV